MTIITDEMVEKALSAARDPSLNANADIPVNIVSWEMRAALEAVANDIWNQAVEACAVKVEQATSDWEYPATEVASAIRSLKGQP